MHWLLAHQTHDEVTIAAQIAYMSLQIPWSNLVASVPTCHAAVALCMLVSIGNRLGQSLSAAK